MYKEIQPSELNEIKEEVFLVDVREKSEYEEVHIKNSKLIPLSDFDSSKIPNDAKKIVIHCRSGGRSARACLRLLNENPDLEVYNLEGGISQWESEGFEIIKGKKKISLNRQVQIITGLVITISIILSYVVSNGFLFLAFFIGSGLIYAGISGKCTLEMILSKLPWNK